MKIEAGKSYRDRNGRKVTVHQLDKPGSMYPFFGDNGFAYLKNGHIDYTHYNSSRDLVAEWRDSPLEKLVAWWRKLECTHGTLDAHKRCVDCGSRVYRNGCLTALGWVFAVVLFVGVMGLLYIGGRFYE